MTDISDFCRLCAESKDPCEIVTSIDDVENSMEQKLRACCQWTTENSGQRLPHNVCMNCLDKLDKCWLFSQSVQLAQQKLLEIIAQNSGNEIDAKPLDLYIDQTANDAIECLNLPPAIAIELENTTDHIEIPNFQCHLCQRSFDSFASLRTHQNQIICENCSISHQIEGCEETFEAGTSAIECKPSVWDGNITAAENDENQAINDNNDYANANEQSNYSYQNESGSSVPIELNRSRTSSRKRTKKFAKSDAHAKCEFCGQAFSFKSNLRVHQRNVHGFKQQYNCNYCEKRFQFKRQLILHRSKHLRKLSQCLLECWLCHQTFRAQHLLKQHMKFHTEIITDESSDFQCDICNKIFENRRRLRAHCRFQNRNKCEICSRHFCKGPALIAHRKQGCQKLMEIDVNGKPTAVALSLDICTAENNETSKQSFGLVTCVFCRRSFSNKSNLRFHQRKAHSLKYQYDCDVCGEPFAYKKELIAHRFVHSRIAYEFECWLCHQTFRSEYLLKEHVRNHIPDTRRITTYGASNFECQICQETFKSHRRLRAHCKYHCEICSQRFCTALELTAHRKQGCQKLIELDVNGESTATASNLASHAAKYDDGNECAICGRNFSFKSNLRVHQRNVHRLENQYNCNDCGRSFAFKKELTLHRFTECNNQPAVMQPNPEFNAENDSNANQYDLNSKQSDNDQPYKRPSDNGNEPDSFGSVDFERKSALKNVETRTEGTKKSIQLIECKPCNQIFSSKSNLRIHQRNAHGFKQPFHCDKCDKSFEYKRQLISHRSTHIIVNSDNRYVCPVCNRAFATEAILQGHQRTIHSDKFKCNECDLIFTVRSDLLKHRDKQHTDKQYSCEYCYRKFWQLSNLYSHQRIKHLGLRPFECMDCGKRYDYESRYREHRLKHSTTRKSDYLCECWLCHKMFHTKFMLKRHMKVHLKEPDESKPVENQLICELCGMSYTQAAGLSDHKKTAHSNERPFKCNVCRLGFKTKHLLRSHLQQHSGIQYDCNQCEKSFRTKHGLKSHLEYHTGTVKKPFACDVCGKAFRINLNLVEHRRIHTGEKPFACDHCSSNFRTMSSFYSHLKKIHGISVSAQNREKQMRETEMT